MRGGTANVTNMTEYARQPRTCSVLEGEATVLQARATASAARAARSPSTLSSVGGCRVRLSLSAPFGEDGRVDIWSGTYMLNCLRCDRQWGPVGGEADIRPRSQHVANDRMDRLQR